MNSKTIISITLALVIHNSLYANEAIRIKSIIPTTTGQIISVYTNKAPVLDGITDPLWSKAKILNVEVVRILEPNIGTKANVTIRSLYSKTHVDFNVSWQDTTHSTSHKTCIWNNDTKTYAQGADREDMFALVFENKGIFNIDMLANANSVWDVWHWKAFRTNPQSYSMDKQHIYSLTKPLIKSKPYQGRKGKTIWISRPEDDGISIEQKRSAPTKYVGDKVVQYLEKFPFASSADVKAKGIWKNGRWTLEFARRLNTNHSDDTAFDINKSYAMALAPFDHTGNMDMASGKITLKFK